MNLWTKTLILLIVGNFFRCLVFQSPEKSTDDKYICDNKTNEELEKKLIECQTNKWSPSKKDMQSEYKSNKSCCFSVDSLWVVSSFITQKCIINESFDEWIQNMNESVLSNCSINDILPNEELCRPLIACSSPNCSQYNYPGSYQNPDAPKQCPINIDPEEQYPNPDYIDAFDTTTHSDGTTDEYIPPNSFRALSLEIVTILTAIIAILSLNVFL